MRGTAKGGGVEGLGGGKGERGVLLQPGRQARAIRDVCFDGAGECERGGGALREFRDFRENGGKSISAAIRAGWPVRARPGAMHRI